MIEGGWEREGGVHGGLLINKKHFLALYFTKIKFSGIELSKTPNCSRLESLYGIIFFMKKIPTLPLKDSPR